MNENHPNDDIAPNFTWRAFFKRCRLPENLLTSVPTIQEVQTPERHPTLRGLLESLGDQRGQGGVAGVHALRFILLTYFFDVRGNKTAGESLNDIHKDLFDNVAFQPLQGVLNSELKGYGLSLLKSGKRYQYLRTIMYYSGWMYVRFAERIQKNHCDGRAFSWSALESDRRSLEDLVSRYTNAGDDEVRKMTEDVLSFFKNLGELYLRRNAPFSKEEVMEMQPSLLPKAAEKIVEVLCPENAGDGRGSLRMETLPQIDVDCDGNAVFTLPETGVFPQGTTRVVFEFFDAQDSVVCSVEYRSETCFRREEIFGRLGNCRLSRIRKITRTRISEQNAPQKSEDVLPRVCNDPETPYLVFRLKGNPGNYRLDGFLRKTDALVRGTIYKAESLAEKSLAISKIADGKCFDLPAENGIFRVPANADSVRIDDDEYFVESEDSAFLAMENAVRERFDNKQYPGRRYFEKSKPLFSDAARNGIVRYSWSDESGARQVVEFSPNTPPPEKALCRLGKLELLENGQNLLSRALPVTFIEDFNWRPTEEPLDMEEEREFELFSDVNVKVESRGKYAEGEYRGFHLRIPVKRTGVYFELDGEKYPVRRETEGAQIRHIARADFKRLRLRVRPQSELDLVEIVRETQSICYDARKHNTGLGISGDERWSNDSDWYAVKITSVSHGVQDYAYYKFHVYNPRKTKVSSEGCVVYNTDGDDLVLSYWCALSDRSQKKSLLFFPAHRQDEKPIAFEADEHGHEIDAATGRCRETIRIRDFYKKAIDWGRGLLCFVAYPLKDEFRIVSSGFPLKSPDGATLSLSPEDDPYNLRCVIAGDGNFQVDTREIQKILTSEAPDAQNYFADFFEKMMNNLFCLKDEDGTPVAFEYLNSFRNTATNETSGYAFMSPGFRRRIFEEKEEDAKGLWHSLLRTYEEGIYRPEAFDRNFLWNAIVLRGLIDNLPPIHKKRLWRHIIEILQNNQEVEVEYDNIPFKRILPRTSLEEPPTSLEEPPTSPNEADSFFDEEWHYSFPRILEALKAEIEKGIDEREIKTRMRNNGATEPLLLVIGSMLESLSDSDKYFILRQEGIPFLPSKLGGDRQEACSKGFYKILRPSLNNFEDTPYEFYGGYDVKLQENTGIPPYKIHYYLDPNNIEKVIEKLGKRLHNWRKKPSLDGAQQLREIFIFFDSIGEIGKKILDAVNSEAWKLRDKELKQR